MYRVKAVESSERDIPALIETMVIQLELWSLKLLHEALFHVIYFVL